MDYEDADEGAHADADADVVEENPYSQVILESEFVKPAGDSHSAFKNSLTIN